MGRAAATFVVLGLLAAAPAGAAGEADARRALETLARAALYGPELRGPSPTRAVTDLVRAPPESVVPVLEEAWDGREELSWRAARCVEEVVRFLHGEGGGGEPLPPGRPEAGGPWLYAGAVLLRCEESTERFAGPFAGDDLPPFDEVFRGRDLRPPPRPDAAKLLAAIESGEVDGWVESERLSLAMALGEAAADAPETQGRLLALLARDPGDRLLGIAAARSGSAGAAPPLRRRFLALAGAGRHDLFFELAEVGLCLERAEPGAVRAAVNSLDGEAREAALGAVGLELVAPALLRELRAAKDAAWRRAALRELAGLVGESGGRGGLPARILPEVLESFVSLLDGLTGRDRETLLAVAEELFYAHNRYEIRSSWSANDNRFAETGASIGPYPDMETVLGAMAEEAAAGRIVFLDEDEPPLSAVPERLGGEAPRAHSDVPCPEPNRSEPGADFPVRLSAEWVDAGLRIRLENLGGRAFHLSPAALRVGTGKLTDAVVERDGKREEYRQLRLEPGFIRTAWATPAEALVRVAPGDAYEWVQPVREEDRDVDRVVVSWSRLTILGRAPGPVLTDLGDTWVK